MEKIDVITYYFKNDGVIPNNTLPLLVYKNVLKYIASENFELVFKKNGWTNNWKDIILPYDHFHSNTHEVLGLAKGNARLRLGGKNGSDLWILTKKDTTVATTYYFNEKSSFGVLEGQVIINEK